MDRCSTCTHWDQTNHETGFGNCAMMEYSAEDKRWHLFRVETPSSLDTVYVETAAEFGCVMHEPR